jgi:UDP-N-acetylmuramoylalanine--D-glutamate ligase
MSETAAQEPRKVTVLGAGVSGVSLALLAKKLGMDVFVSDKGKISDTAREKFDAAGIRYEEGGHTEAAESADAAIAGSGFPPDAPALELLARNGVRLTGELDFALPRVKGRVIGVTGSNGKTTTTSLLAHLINAAGAKCAAAGNIGSPIADFAGSDYEFIALELSSFQLHWAEDIRLSGAVVTNLAPDHIDWHGSYEKYAAAKAKIMNFVVDGGFAIVQKRDAETLGAARDRADVLSWDETGDQVIKLDAKTRAAYLDGGELFRFDETTLLGSHNMENIAMAMAAVKRLGLDAGKARAALKSFVPPAHRCSLVLEHGGVRYIDDSKGTNIAASSTAMSSIEGPHVVILGGRGKGEDYAEIVAPLKKYARCAILIGEEAGAIARALRGGGYSEYREAGDMESAVRLAAALAKPGDAVLLSPACTSWDAYANYKERGDHFASLVKELAGRAK